MSVEDRGYVKHIWVKNEIITSTNLNHLEDGLATEVRKAVEQDRLLESAIDTENERAILAERAIDAKADTNTGAIITLNADKNTPGSVDYKIAQATAEMGGHKVTQDHTEIENPSPKYIYLEQTTSGKVDNYQKWIWTDLEGQGDYVWRCIGETSLDLSNYVQKTDYATTTNAGVVKVDGTTITINNGVISAIQKIVIYDVPSQSGTLTYNGSSQSPTWDNYNSDWMVMGGTTSGTNAGTYTATFTPLSGYKWADNTDTTKSVTWSIGKANGALNISKTSVALNESKLSDTVTCNGQTGTLSVETSDSEIATASISGSTVTITNVDKNNGIATITITSQATTNYTEVSKTVSVTTTFVQIYGAEWNGTSTTAWTRTDKASNFVDPVPAVGTGSGSSPFDNILPWSGVEKQFDTTLGWFVKIPKYYFKWTRTGSKMKLQISSEYFTDSFVSPAHADRGDGVGERDYVYVGMFHCDQYYHSGYGNLPKVNVSRADFRTNIHNNGATVWQWDYAMYWTIAMLYLVEFASWDVQRKIGYGGSSTGTGIEASSSPNAMNYHTGRVLSTGYWGHTRYRYIEDLWGNCFDWIDGIYFSGTSVYCIKNPASFGETGGTFVGTRASNTGLITSWTNPSASGFEYALYPSSVQTGLNPNEYIDQYISDQCIYNNSSKVVCHGGTFTNYDPSNYSNQTYGLFMLNDYLTTANEYTGSRLMKLP